MVKEKKFYIEKAYNGYYVYDCIEDYLKSLSYFFQRRLEEDGSIDEHLKIGECDGDPKETDLKEAFDNSKKVSINIKLTKTYE